MSTCFGRKVLFSQEFLAKDSPQLGACNKLFLRFLEKFGCKNQGHPNRRSNHNGCNVSHSDFLFPLQPHPAASQQAPWPSHPRELDSSPFRARFGSFARPFRVRFGSVSGPFRSVGWGWGGVGERGFCKGKEKH